MTFIINPGTGPVEGASEDEARANIAQLILDAGLDHCGIYDTDSQPGDGRYRFRLSYDDKTCEVDVPGLPIERVRYLGKPHQNIFDFPRLYVDGSSWLWGFAVGMVRDRLVGEDE